jgi:5-methyltetrahydrofolate--homocysteine methyltransferase
MADTFLKETKKSMIIIGEKINGSIPAVAEAIANRDAEFIKARAIAQENAGATYIDCCASVPEDQEVETLKWMIDCIQEVTDLPISVDSPSPAVLAQAYKFCKRPGIFNSVSGEGDKIDTIFPIMAQPENKGWQVIALLSDDTGIPKCAADRLNVFTKIMAKAKEYGISPDRLHIDPLVEMLCTSENGIETNVEVIQSVRSQYPTIHITAAISNISFNLPVRKLINQGFMVLAMNAGLDSAIMDPTNRDMLGLVYATEALLGLDDYCMEYIGAYREGMIGPVKK